MIDSLGFAQRACPDASQRSAHAILGFRALVRLLVASVGEDFGLLAVQQRVGLDHVADIARSTYYYQCQPNARAEQQSDMQCRIRAVYDKDKGRYGYRRITATLSKSMAEPVNHKCVQRLMQKMGLRALIRAKKRSRGVPGVSNVHVPNVLQRNFLASAPNQKWVTDITEFNVNGHKLYLSACMDLYNSEIIAHRMARRPVFDLVSGTLGAVLSRAGHTGELTVHSDQGWHYNRWLSRKLSLKAK